jgi:hypothetical protein
MSRRAAEEARARCDLVGHLRNLRDQEPFDALLEHAPRFTRAEFSSLLGEKYLEADRPWRWPVVEKLFLHRSVEREHLMSLADRRACRALPALRGTARLWHATCRKEDAFAYFPSHGEEELLILHPERLVHARRVRLGG